MKDAFYIEIFVDASREGKRRLMMQPTVINRIAEQARQLVEDKTLEAIHMIDDAIEVGCQVTITLKN